MRGAPNAPTLTWYRACYTSYREWLTTTHSVVAAREGDPDVIVAEFFDHLYEMGRPVSDARDMLYGYIFIHSLPKKRDTLPRARRALVGFTRCEPGHVRDPAPLEAVVVVCDWLLNQNTLLHHLAAIALWLSFDMYLRPSEALDATREAVVPPSGRRYARWGFTIAVSADDHDPDAPLPRPAKNGEFDHTVFAGVVPGAARDRTARVLASAYRLCEPGRSLLEPLTLAMYERLLAFAMTELNLRALKFTPHSARHGGPSTDAYFDRMDLNAIQRRGRWAQLRSVRRYKKKGTLQRQINRMPSHLVRRGQHLFDDSSPGGLQARLCAAARPLRLKRPASDAAWQPPVRRPKRV